jgi:hypothetical protein
MPVSSSAYFSTPEMKVTRSSETSIDFQGIKRRFVPEDGTHFGDGSTGIGNIGH